MLVGGSIALGSHGAKASTRLAANTSPEPFSNIALSLFEDAIAFGSAVVMAFHPVVILAIVAIFLVFAIWFFRRIFRAIRRLFRRDDAGRSTGQAESPA
jgi:ABC-type Na+ efflux pump permease subunit